MAEPELSVVVPTRDRAPRLAALLDSLGAQTLPRGRFEVIVVDDGSRDDTPRILEQHRSGTGPELRVAHSGGRGPAAARNRGWREARGSLIAFIDDDCEATPPWLEELLAAAAAAPGAFVQGPTAPNPRELASHGPFSRTRDVPGPEAGPWFQTCNILYPRELLERLDGFDERFPDAQGEDTDLGWRALEAGAEATFAPRAMVHHGVERLGPVGTLRTALRGPDAVYVFRRHPALRARTLRLGVSRNPSLARLALALAALALARRSRASLLLSLPYARDLLGRCRRAGASPLLAPFFVVYDVLFGFNSLRGSVRHRTLVL